VAGDLVVSNFSKQASLSRLRSLVRIQNNAGWGTDSIDLPARTGTFKNISEDEGRQPRNVSMRREIPRIQDPQIRMQQVTGKLKGQRDNASGICESRHRVDSRCPAGIEGRSEFSNIAQPPDEGPSVTGKPRIIGESFRGKVTAPFLGKQSPVQLHLRAAFREIDGGFIGGERHRSVGVVFASEPAVREAGEYFVEDAIL